MSNKEENGYLIFLKDYIPVISGLLIFLGYWNLDSYYNTFNIRIYDYVNASEILLSFLPVIKDVAITTVYVVLFFLLLAVLFFIKFKFENKHDDSTYEKIDDDALITFDIIKAIENIVKLFSVKEFFGSRYILLNFLYLLGRMTLIGINLLLYGVIFKNLWHIIQAFDNSEILLKPEKDIVGGAFVFTLLFLLVIYYTLFDKTASDNLVKKYRWVFLIVILTSATITIGNKKIAVQKLSNKNNVPVRFKISDSVITTNSDLIYIGQTQNYLFLRRLSDSTNVIFKMADIISLESK